MKKPAKPVKRNPVAAQMHDPKFRTQKAKSTAEREAQRDKWDRTAKHKKVDDLMEFFQHGDVVEITSGPLKDVMDRAEKIRATKAKKEGKEEEAETKEEKAEVPKEQRATVKEPNGPGNTIGISLDGKYHLVSEDDVKLICEAFDDLLEMRYVETMGGLRMPISQEEQEVYDMAGEKLYKSTLDERSQETARKMVSRGLLNRRKDDNGIFFLKNSSKVSRF